MNEELRDKTVRTVCIDFDGVLYDYKGWHEPPWDLTEGPVEGAVEFCHEAVMFFKIVICSARFQYPGVMESAREWLEKYAFPDGIELSYIKPLAFIYIDDRGWTFNGIFPTIQELQTFVTYQERARIYSLLQK
jgi:hypothetical protein